MPPCGRIILVNFLDLTVAHCTNSNCNVEILKKVRSLHETTECSICDNSNGDEMDDTVYASFFLRD